VAMIRKRVGKKKGSDGKVRKTVSYQAVIRKEDHPPQYRTFATKREAQIWSTSVENVINKDEYIPSAESKRRKIVDMLERYRKSELHKKKDWRNYERHLDFWIDKIGPYRISAVSRSQIVTIRDEMLDVRSPATVNRYLATLRHAFRIAETDWEWANKNPLQRIMLTEPRGRDRHLSDEEIKALLSASSESDHPHLYAIVLIGLTTGARRSEITGLSWKDVDLTKGRAFLRQTKNQDKRTVALVPQVVAELGKLRKVRRIDDDRIFTNPNRGTRTHTALEAAWTDARARAKLDDFRFHDLRHVCWMQTGAEKIRQTKSNLRIAQIHSGASSRLFPVRAATYSI
jgi:integrase